MNMFQQLTPEQQIELEKIRARTKQITQRQAQNQYVPNSGGLGVFAKVYDAWVQGRNLNKQEEKLTELLKQAKADKKERMSQLAQVLGWETPKPAKGQGTGQTQPVSSQTATNEATPGAAPPAMPPGTVPRSTGGTADRLMQYAIQTQDEGLLRQVLAAKLRGGGTMPVSTVGKLYADMERDRQAGTLTPQRQQAYEQAIRRAGKGTDVTINNIPQVKPGQILKRDAGGNYYIENVQGAKPKSREEAATIQGVQQGVKTVRELFYGGIITNPATGKQYKIPGIFDANGNIDRQMIASMYTNFPGSDGRVHRGRIKDALQAKLRAETGAAAPDAEVRNLMSRYMPSIYDSDKEIVDKLNRLKNFTSGFLAQTDPQLYRELRTRVLSKRGMSKSQIETQITQEIKQGGMAGIATESTIPKGKPDKAQIQKEGDEYYLGLDPKIPEAKRKEMTNEFLRKRFGL